MAEIRDGDRAAESQRILDRIRQEADTSGFSILDRTVGRGRDHLTAADADQTDWAEVWGTRIGRMVGAALVCALFLWALSLIAGN